MKFILFILIALLSFSLHARKPAVEPWVRYDDASEMDIDRIPANQHQFIDAKKLSKQPSKELLESAPTNENVDSFSLATMVTLSAMIFAPFFLWSFLLTGKEMDSYDENVVFLQDRKKTMEKSHDHDDDDFKKAS